MRFKLTAEIIGQFANNKDVQQELLNFATVEHNFEVSAKFSDLLNVNSSSERSNLKFASKFREHLQNTSARFDIDIEQYLIDNNFILYAPYFAEYHKNTDLPITMSWHNGIDSTGFTEGFIVNTSGRSAALLINDDYAIKNLLLS